MQLGPVELVVILVIVLLLFGGKQMADRVVETRKLSKHPQDDDPPATQPGESQPVQPKPPSTPTESEPPTATGDAAGRDMHKVSVGDVQDAVVTVGDRNTVITTILQQSSLAGVVVKLPVFVSSGENQQVERCAVQQAAEKYGFLEVRLEDLIPSMGRTPEQVEAGLRASEIFLLFGSDQVDEAQLAEQRLARQIETLHRFTFAPLDERPAAAHALDEPLETVTGWVDAALLPDLIASRMLGDIFRQYTTGKVEAAGAASYRLSLRQVSLLLAIGAAAGFGLHDELLADVRSLLEAQLPDFHPPWLSPPGVSGLPPAAPETPTLPVNEPVRVRTEMAGSTTPPQKELSNTWRKQPVEPELIHIPAGEFWMGADEADKQAYRDEKPLHQVYLDEYWIGRYPVTVAQFQIFVEQSGYQTTDEKQNRHYTRSTPSGKGSDVLGKAQHPATQVSWEDAQAYCRWLSRVSGRNYALPSEAQWEKAARGTDGRIYPWGCAAPNREHCNILGWYNRDTTVFGRFSPLGDGPKFDNPYGCADMAGNVWEWCADWYAQDYYASSPRRNPPGPEGESTRVLRGGSWRDSERLARCSFRYRNNPDYFDHVIGFRVVVCLSLT